MSLITYLETCFIYTSTHNINIALDWLIEFEKGRRGEAVDRARVAWGAKPQAELKVVDILITMYSIPYYMNASEMPVLIGAI